MYLGYIWLYRDSIEKAFLCPAQGKRQWIRPERETDLLVLSLTNSLMRGEPWMT